MLISRSGPLLIAAVALLASVVQVRDAAAQSLGDIARAEAERRKQVDSGRAYTNDDLSPEAGDKGQAAVQPASTSTPAASKPDSTGGFVTEEDPSKGIVDIKSTTSARPKRDEQYWRARVKEIRQRQAKAQTDLSATEQRLQALDAGAQTPLTARERQLTATALERLRADARLADQAMTQLKTMAEAAKIPMEWIQ